MPSTTQFSDSRRGWSLTLWLTCSNALSAFSLISLIALLLYGGLAAQLRHQNRLYLHDEANSVEKMIRSGGNGAALLREVGPEHIGEEYLEHFIRLMDPEQRVILETPGMSVVIPPKAFPIPERGGASGPDRTMRFPNGDAILSTTRWVDSDEVPGGKALLQVALDVSNVERILIDYRHKIYLALGFGLLLCVAVSFAIARRGARPLREMTEQVRRITVTNLEDRIAGAGWPAEVGSLADAMNHMLNRLEDSFRRLYTSANNLSHKLRTPLTIMRGEAEVALSRKRSAEELEDVIASGLEEVGRLLRLSESILFLANAEMGKFQVERTLIDCREEAETVLDYYTPVAEEKGVTLCCRGEARVVADPTLFSKALSALISNAITYNRPGGSVILTLIQEEGQAAEFSVTDTGCGIERGELVKVFDRFYRIYGTRHMDPHGTGLGLCIVKAIMDLHAGCVTLASDPGVGTTVRLVFPAPEHPQALAPAARPAEAAPLGAPDRLYRSPQGEAAASEMVAPSPSP